MDRPIVLPRSRHTRTALAAGVVGAVVAALLPVLMAAPAAAAVTFTSTAVNQASARCMTVPGGASDQRPAADPGDVSGGRAVVHVHPDQRDE